MYLDYDRYHTCLLHENQQLIRFNCANYWCSLEPRVFQVAYSSDTPQFWHHRACYKYNFHCIQAGKIAQTL